MKRLLLAVAVGMTFIVTAFSQEVTIPKGVEIGVSIGERAGVWGETLDLTSPYFPLFNGAFAAIKLGGDAYVLGGLSTSGSSETWGAYYAARLGFVVARALSQNLALYSNLGGLMLFPTSDVSSSTDPQYGFFVSVGFEFFPLKNRLTGAFFEVGDQTTFSPIGADKIQGSPLIGTGPIISTGARFHL